VISYAIYENKRLSIIQKRKKMVKKHGLREKKTPIAKKSPFYKEKLKNDGLNKFFPPLLMILLGIEALRTARYSLVGFWWPRRPWRPRKAYGLL
jgi:hypothetical protein